VTFNHKKESYKEDKTVSERGNAFFKSSPVDEYHLPQMNSEKCFLGAYLRFGKEHKSLKF
jgi:hypothetical protein